MKGYGTNVVAGVSPGKEVSNVGGDLGKAAVATVQGSIDGAEKVSVNSADSVTAAVKGVVTGADEITSDAGVAVRKALLSAAALPKDVIEAAIKGITHNPFSFQNVLPDVHRALVRRFPYGVFYTVKDDLIVVLAVFHGRRSPENWRKRG